MEKLAPIPAALPPGKHITPIQYVDTVGVGQPREVPDVAAKYMAPVPKLWANEGGDEKETLLPFKYNEAEILSELKTYLLSTYGQHYVGKDNVQLMDLIMAGDEREALGFFRYNATKYAMRFGKKKGRNRDDLLKALHYTFFMLYLDTKMTEQAAGQKAG